MARKPKPERLAAIFRDERGDIRQWLKWQAGPMTCNEAEYTAVILALESLREARPSEVAVYSDSRVVVDQMRGLARVRSAGLLVLHNRLRALTIGLGRVTFHYIPREQNRLADALANEALGLRLSEPEPSQSLFR